MLADVAGEPRSTAIVLSLHNRNRCSTVKQDISSQRKTITNKRHVLCQGTRFGTGHTQEADVLDQRNADDRHPGNCSTPCFRLGGITFLEVPSRHQTNLFPVSLKFRRNNSHWLRDIWQQLICRFVWDYGCISTQDPWRGSSEK